MVFACFGALELDIRVPEEGGCCYCMLERVSMPEERVSRPV